MSAIVNQNYGEHDQRFHRGSNQQTPSKIKDPIDLVTSAFDDSDEDESLDYRVKGEDKYLTPTKYRSDKNIKKSSFYSNISNEPTKHRTYSIRSFHQDGHVRTQERVIVPTIYKNSENSSMKPTSVINDGNNSSSLSGNVAERPLSPVRVPSTSSIQSLPPLSPSVRKPSIRTNANSNGTHHEQDTTSSQTGLNQQTIPSNTNEFLSRRSTQSSIHSPKQHIIDEKPAYPLTEQLRLGQPYRISGEIQFVEKASVKGNNSETDRDPEFGLVFNGTIRGLEIKRQELSSVNGSGGQNSTTSSAINDTKSSGTSDSATPSSSPAVDGQRETENAKDNEFAHLSPTRKSSLSESSHGDHTKSFAVENEKTRVDSVNQNQATPRHMKKDRPFNFGAPVPSSDTEDDNSSPKFHFMGGRSKPRVNNQNTVDNRQTSANSPKHQVKNPLISRNSTAIGSQMNHDRRNSQSGSLRQSPSDGAVHVQPYYNDINPNTKEKSPPRKVEVYDSVTAHDDEQSTDADVTKDTDTDDDSSTIGQTKPKPELSQRGIGTLFERSPLAINNGSSNTQSTDRSRPKDNGKNKKSEKPTRK